MKNIIIQTPLGSMLAIGSDEALYLLDFVDNSSLAQKIARFKIIFKTDYMEGYTKPLQQIESELKEYFARKLKVFKTPVYIWGSLFQKQAWQELINIPYGQTISYRTQSLRMENPQAHRAVGSANGKNCLSILIPCHRVINNNGNMGGYGGGLNRKKWLLKMESAILK